MYFFFVILAGECTQTPQSCPVYGIIALEMGNWSFLRRLTSGPSGLVFSVLIFVLSLAGSGCTTAWVQDRRLAPTGLTPKDAIAIIVTAPVKDEYLSGLENQVAGCVQSAIGEIHRDIRIILPNEFRKLVFPNLTMEQIPAGYFSWRSLLQDPTFDAKIAPLGLRYVLAVDTEEGRRLTEVDWTAATSMLGGPGPTLNASWENSVLFETIVADAKNHRIAGAVHAYAAGKSGAGLSLMTSPFPFLLPHGMPSFPFGVACRGLGEGLAKFLADENREEAQATPP